MKLTKTIGLFLLIILSCIILYCRFGKILTAEPHQVIQAYGDAFNAYNLVTYHSKYDSTYTVFEGMAYPYGDHVVIASAIPLLSNGLKFLKYIGIDWTDYTVQILHCSMLLSYIVCSIFLYLILVKLNLPIWYAIPIAIALTFMSPQTERLFGHYGLAHLYAIPATIYFLMLFDEKPKWGVSICLFLTVVLTSLIQFYFFAITAFMISGFYFFSFIKEFQSNKINSKKGFPKQSFFRYAIHFSFHVLLPYFLFTWWISEYEVPNRPDKPAGYLAYITYWEGLFTSLRMPYYEWINDNIIPIRKVNFEGLAYTGLVAFAVFLYMTYFWLRSLFKQSFFKKLTISQHNKLASDYDTSDFLRRLFAMSFVLLLLSFGLPFSLPKLDFLLDYAGPLKQFRSVGRFNWIFYFVLNIIAFTYLFSIFQQRKSLLLIPIMILIYESWQFNHARPYNMGSVEEFKNDSSFEIKTGIDFSKYQALLPLPYFNVGTDNFNAIVHGRIQQKSLALSMETGLPSLASMGNRSSVSRAYKLFQIVSEPYRIPSILKDFKNNKPLLMMVDTNHIHEYPHMINEVKHIKTVGEMSYYEVPLSSFETRIKNRKTAMQKKLNNEPLYEIDGIMTTDSLKTFVYNRFNSLQNNYGYRSDGGLKLDISKPYTLFRKELDFIKKNDEVVISFWCNLTQYPTATTFVNFRIYNPENNAKIWEFKPQIRYLIPVMDNNGWCLFELPIKIENTGILEISLFNKEMRNKPFFADELLIRKKSTDVYMEGAIYENNRWY